MHPSRRSLIVYGLLGLVWLVVMIWQVEEHLRVQAYARSALRNRSRDIASTLGSFIRILQWRGQVFPERLQPVLDELVRGDDPGHQQSGEVLSVVLLNAAGEPVTSAGLPVDLSQTDLFHKGERWGPHRVEIVHSIEGARLPEGPTNAPVLLPPFTNSMGEGGSRFPRPEGRVAPPKRPSLGTNQPGERIDRPPPDPDRDSRPRRPFWARRLDEKEYKAMAQQRELHGLVLSMSTEGLQALIQRDIWLRSVIGFFATLSVIGSGLAWRNVVRSSELQIRLVRASEMNTHLKGMNLAAAGLAHETRNPLNLIRGLAQIISKQLEAPPEIREKSIDIVNEADKVAAQLNEFINYSRPREVRRSAVPLNSLIGEVSRALKYDLDEKSIRLEVAGDSVSVLADEQLLRQVLFNLLLNATQAVGLNGSIRIVARKQGASEALIEVQDDGPGVPPENRTEVFKPYFTTQKTGTGLGLAVVQQIVLAHGWEIECLPNTPQGAIFRVSHIALNGR